MEKEAIVLYTSMGQGHLTPMVLLAERLTNQGFSVQIVTIDTSNHQPGSTNNPSLKNPSLNPLITYHPLPAVSLPASENKHRVVRKYEVIEAYTPKVRDFLTALSSSATKIRAMVVDFFHTDAIRVARELKIPVYVFMTSGASILAIFLHLSFFPPEKSFKDMGDASLILPGVPAIPAFEMPEALHDRERVIYECFVKNKQQLIEADGIIINTFEALEPRAVAALKQGNCVGNHMFMPPVYCVGPLVKCHGNEEHRASHDCVAWLDTQPNKSVVFLCFGSVGGFTPTQIKEIAVGLENSGHIFLWVVCSKEDAKSFYDPRSEPDLNFLLPEGFLSRTKDRGMVVKLWAPQNEVLNHRSVGGFVSHCGWNSALEAVFAGVPMVCWPLYAEQGINKVVLVEEMKVGVAMKGEKNGVVGADEIEEAVRWLMESEAGETVRECMEGFKEKARVAVKGGPLDRELEALVRDMGVQKERTAAA